MTTPAQSASALARTSTGLPGLDQLLEGGFPANRSVLVCGNAGLGKTSLALQFLAAGLERGEPGAFVSVDEKPRHVLEDASRLGLDLERAVADGTMALLDASPYFTATRKSRTRSEVDARQVSADLARQVRDVGARRLAIDSVTSLVPPELGRSEAQDYLRSLVQALEDNFGCTILLTCRGARNDPQGICDSARNLVSGVLQLKLARVGRGFVRTMLVSKMRGTRLDLAEYVFNIEPGCGLMLAGRADVLAPKL